MTGNTYDPLDAITNRVPQYGVSGFNANVDLAIFDLGNDFTWPSYNPGGNQLWPTSDGGGNCLSDPGIVQYPAPLGSASNYFAIGYLKMLATSLQSNGACSTTNSQMSVETDFVQYTP